MIPLLEFDPAVGVIEPSEVVEPRDVPACAVLCFFSEVIERIAARGDAREVAVLRAAHGRHPIWEIELDGQRLAVFHPGVGAPLAAGFLEEAIALGCKRFVAVGGAGALVPELVLGHAVIVESALRDEGTSFHYLPASRTVDADPAGVAALRAVLDEAQAPYLVGRSWTTDGFYRETRGKVDSRRNEGCLTVEMEASAFMAVARFRGVGFAQLLYAGDSLAGESWDSRRWTAQHDVREKLVLAGCSGRAAAAGAGVTPVRVRKVRGAAGPCLGPGTTLKITQGGDVTTAADIIPANEADRMRAVRRYDILDTPPDGAFDRIAELAAELLGVPIAIVSIVDTDRIWFKSHHGLDGVSQIDRDPGLCASAILHETPWVVTDAEHDPRTLANPLVAGDFGLRFYVGVPLTTHDGYNLGTLCVLDKAPRPVTETQIEMLPSSLHSSWTSSSCAGAPMTPSPGGGQARRGRGACPGPPVEPAAAGAARDRLPRRRGELPPCQPTPGRRRLLRRVPHGGQRLGLRHRRRPGQGAGCGVSHQPCPLLHEDRSLLRGRTASCPASGQPGAAHRDPRRG